MFTFVINRHNAFWMVCGVSVKKAYQSKTNKDRSDLKNYCIADEYLMFICLILPGIWSSTQGSGKCQKVIGGRRYFLGARFFVSFLKYYTYLPNQFDETLLVFTRIRRNSVSRSLHLSHLTLANQFMVLSQVTIQPYSIANRIWQQVAITGAKCKIAFNE